MKVEHILASSNVKAGDGPSEAEFYIAPSTVADQNVVHSESYLNSLKTSLNVAKIIEVGNTKHGVLIVYAFVLDIYGRRNYSSS
ncbi:hypothetical protein Tco_0381755 [Tanacetum coccineum]